MHSHQVIYPQHKVTDEFPRLKVTMEGYGNYIVAFVLAAA